VRDVRALDDHCVGLSSTAKRPESEESVEAAQATGCGRSVDVVTFVGGARAQLNHAQASRA